MGMGTEAFRRSDQSSTHGQTDSDPVLTARPLLGHVFAEGQRGLSRLLIPHPHPRLPTFHNPFLQSPDRTEVVAGE